MAGTLFQKNRSEKITSHKEYTKRSHYPCLEHSCVPTLPRVVPQELDLPTTCRFPSDCTDKENVDTMVNQEEKKVVYGNVKPDGKYRS